MLTACLEANGFLVYWKMVVYLFLLQGAEVIDARPRCARPAVVKLPEKRSHRAAPVSSPVLDTVLYRDRLQYLCQVKQAFKVFREKAIVQSFLSRTL